MKRAQFLLTTMAIILILGSVPALAQGVAKINFTTMQPQTFTPIPGKADPHRKSSAWVCSSAGGQCLMFFPGFIGMACQCCFGIPGCFPGVVTGFVSADRPENVAQNR